MYRVRNVFLKESPRCLGTQRNKVKGVVWTARKEPISRTFLAKTPNKTARRGTKKQCPHLKVKHAHSTSPTTNRKTALALEVTENGMGQSHHRRRVLETVVR